MPCPNSRFHLFRKAARMDMEMVPGDLVAEMPAARDAHPLVSPISPDPAALALPLSISEPVRGDELGFLHARPVTAGPGAPPRCPVAAALASEAWRPRRIEALPVFIDALRDAVPEPVTDEEARFLLERLVTAGLGTLCCDPNFAGGCSGCCGLIGCRRSTVGFRLLLSGAPSGAPLRPLANFYLGPFEKALLALPPGHPLYVYADTTDFGLVSPAFERGGGLIMYPDASTTHQWYHLGVEGIFEYAPIDMCLALLDRISPALLATGADCGYPFAYGFLRLTRCRRTFEVVGTNERGESFHRIDHNAKTPQSTAVLLNAMLDRVEMNGDGASLAEPAGPTKFWLRRELEWWNSGVIPELAHHSPDMAAWTPTLMEVDLRSVPQSPGYLDAPVKAALARIRAIEAKQSEYPQLLRGVLRSLVLFDRDVCGTIAEYMCHPLHRAVEKTPPKSNASKSNSST